jgi:hypothetical protein
VSEQQLGQVPEPVLEGGGLGRLRRGQGVRVDPGQREMPERKPDTPSQLLLDALDRSERLARVRALVIAVLDNQMTFGRAADMINRLVHRLYGRLLYLRHRIARHDKFLLVWTACQRISLGSGNDGRRERLLLPWVATTRRAP